LFSSYNRPASAGATTRQEDSLGLAEVRQKAFSVKALIFEPVNDSNLVQNRQA
jgi:hypothetical protein